MLATFVNREQATVLDVHIFSGRYFTISYTHLLS
jgi:hypothetical protein